MTKNLTDKTHVQRVTPKILFFVLLEMITNMTTHVFAYSISLEISTLHFNHKLLYTLYQLPHWKNAASVTCCSRGGAANLHVV